ncbi:hypothetical protein HDU85_006703 [Gaertneriomyces sp. JEL0708]|nr:hypothetical protein HDU85_006703 [Gaertneriomyces sp. JEL0708]
MIKLHLLLLLVAVLATVVLALPTPTEERSEGDDWKETWLEKGRGKSRGKDKGKGKGKGKHCRHCDTPEKPTPPLASAMSDCLIDCTNKYMIGAETALGTVIAGVCTYRPSYYVSGWKEASQENELGYCEKQCPDGEEFMRILGFVRNSTLCVSPIQLPEDSPAYDFWEVPLESTETVEEGAVTTTATAP